VTRVKWEIPTQDGVLDCTGHAPSTPGPWPGVLLLMDAVGVRETLLSMADRLADNGFFVLLPNFFYRAGAFAPFNPMTLWSDPKERERVMSLVRTLDPAGAMRDVGACLDTLEKTPGVKAHRFGCVGYCMGGMLALRAAAAHPARIAAAASIHGGQLVTDKEDSPHLGVKNIRGRLYLGAADNDRSYTAEQSATLETALQGAGVAHQIEFYPGAQHGFAVKDFPVYDAAASEKHWERVLTLFRETL